MEPDVTAFAKTDQNGLLFGRPQSNLDGFQGSIHLLGIGGIGMSALARLLLSKGITVSGSDKSESEITRDLTNLGATIFIGHNSSNVEQAAAVAISTAIDPKNPELSWARHHNIPIWHRSQLLEALANRKEVVAVSGTHGKTTTTAMIAQILIDCQTDPTVVIGGIFSKIGANAKVGKGQYFVAESDESDGTHAHLKSAIAVITNIEGDHLENYPGGIEEIYETMARFANNASKFALLCNDDAGCRAIEQKLKTRLLKYGKQSADTILNYSYESVEGSSFKVFRDGRELGGITLHVPGEHNQVNAVAALAVAMELGLNIEQISQALSHFHGVNRRFQQIGESRSIRVIDDYAHHPTEIQATLKAARQYLIDKAGQPVSAWTRQAQGRIVALFQPHQPGRLRDFWEQFCRAFTEADVVFVSDVYVARGSQIPGVDAKRFVFEVQHENAHYLPGTTDQLAQALVPNLQPGDLVITIGAGDVTNVGSQLLAILSET